MKKTPPLILVVDDDRTALMVMQAYLQREGYEVITAMNGKVAQELITEHNKKLDAILLDRLLPDMDGIQIVRWIDDNEHISKPPIIMQTVADRPEQVKEGIDVGVFYYLTKPIAEEVLKSIVSSAVKESQQKRDLIDEVGKHRASFKLMQKATFKIQTLNEAEQLSCFVANCFPDSYKILPAIAELLVNAVEHGNCGISYDEKTQLITAGTWREEVDKRVVLAENKNKFVEVVFSKENDKFMVKITDCGRGFRWLNFMNVNHARALDHHGKGIARANMLFSSLEFKEPGNQVTAIVELEQKESFKW